MLAVAAPAKINLYLHVGSRRADGYHALESLVCFTEAGDLLEIVPDRKLRLAIEGPFAAGLSGSGDNLVIRAAAALAEHTGYKAGGAAITLCKNLPVASGIGGGSADAAAALRGLVKLWNLAVDGGALHDLALSLGSDVPVCVNSAPAIMTGRGDGLRPVGSLPPIPMLLVNPGVAVSTAEVFRRLGRTEEDRLAPMPPLPDALTPTGLLSHLAAARNDMEAPARAIAPVIGKVLEALRGAGALLARMCGSGATCYGLFERDADAQAAARAIASVDPRWWVASTRIAPPDIAG